MKVAIVGAGPAGLIAGLYLAEKGAEVVFVEKGKTVWERKAEVKVDLIHGVGGAGLFSDGKLNFSPDIGTNLVGIIGRDRTWKLILEVEEIFRRFGVEAKDEKEEKKAELMVKAAKEGIRYIPARQAHIGSDKLPEVIGKIQEELEKKGAKFYCGEEAVDFDIGVLLTASGKKISFDNLLLAPGRSGARWLEGIVKSKGIEFVYNPVDIGVRVEVSSLIMKDITEINWDPKIYITTPTYDDSVRTFCVSPFGYVVKEQYKNFVLVNGHSRSDVRSENTNFAFLVKVNLTEPLENTNAYGEAIAFEATTIGGGKPILQRLGDLMKGRRSTWHRISKSYVEPTLRDVTPGDISMAMPYRFVKDVLEGLEILNRLIPGVADDSTLIYAPEIKFHGLKVLTDRKLQTNIENVYVAGDGAGLSRGIVGAAASGLLAAKGMLGEVEG